VSVDEAVSAPADAVAEEFLSSLRAELGSDLLDAVIQGQELIVRVPARRWRDSAECARRRLGLTSFCFLSGLDWLDSPLQATRYENVWGSVESDDGDAVAEVSSGSGLQTGLAGGETRFQVFCRLASPTRHRGVTFKADLDEADPRVASLVPVYAGANWHERECWEMYGLWFDGHPGLRHIYLPTGFEGYPLRKDFPLLAREVKPWPGLTNVEPIAGEGDEEGAEG
jgi:NADH-quinone oxidoreductase subunit C